MNNDSFNVINCGVGGQGIVLMCNIVGEAGALIGKNVISGEMHGLAQRSGSVFIHQRIGENAISPLIPFGEADVILALETMEALRYLYYLKPGGLVITNTNFIHPSGETEQLIKNNIEKYVKYDEIINAIKKSGANNCEIDALKLAHDAGNPLTENVVMVGALSAFSDFPIKKDIMLEAVKNIVPKKAVEVNIKAFENGFNAFNKINGGE